MLGNSKLTDLFIIKGKLSIYNPGGACVTVNGKPLVSRWPPR